MFPSFPIGNDPGEFFPRWNLRSVIQKDIFDDVPMKKSVFIESIIVTWIEGTYHRRRRKRSLGKMTPVEYEAANEMPDKELLVA